MKIILKEDVEKLGERGDVVEVADGYARNFLLPKQMAVQAQPGKIEEIKKIEKRKRKKEEEKKEQAREQAAKMEEEKLVFPVKAGEKGRLFGSVTSQDIAEELEQKGFEIDRRNIDLEENIKELGEHQVAIKIYSDISAEVTVEVVEAEE